MKGSRDGNDSGARVHSSEAIRSLKQRVDGGIYVSGSGTLVRAMVADDLVDEIHLFVYPLSLGGGPRLFEDGLAARFTLLASEGYDNGAVHLAYGLVPAK